MDDRPVPTPGLETFWSAAREKRLLLPRCGACARLHWYPRPICPFCFADIGEWVQASGHGTIYSYSVMRRADPPYAVAYVALAEGPKMLTNIVASDLSALATGKAVTLRWSDADSDVPMPIFALT